LACVDDLGESWLEGSSSNKESIDVLHGNELSSVSISDGSTVKNSNGCGGLLGDISCEPLSDFCMGVLSDLWGSGLTGSNSPNWLVSDDDLGPVLAHLSDGIELSIIDILGLA
jgi:hypothetical protein